MCPFVEDPTVPVSHDAVGASAGPTLFANRYEVRTLLGQGGMGAVFRVHDRELLEDVALKVLSSNDPRVLDRFRREVKLARRVTHPNVARTFDLGQHAEARFITMELVEGEALSAVLEREKRMGLAEALRIAEQIARGLSAAHAAGVVHRDLKPANIMRCPGANGRIVITDFGIARLAEGVARDEEVRLTGSGLIGTPAYMAPEQLADEPIDGRTDIYAFGLLLFEMLAGKHPFDDVDVMASVAARLTGQVPDLKAVARDTPDPLARLIERTLGRRREERPDAEMVLQELERLRGGGGRAREIGAVRERLTKAAVSSHPDARAACERAAAAIATRALPAVAAAVADLEKACAEHPDDPPLLCLLGSALVHVFSAGGSIDASLVARAEDLLLRALAQDPSLARAYHAIGFLRGEQGELRASVRAYQEATLRDPLFADAHAALGFMVADTGHPEEAIVYFDAALRLEPASVWIRVERARVRALLGDREAAEKDLADAGPARFALLTRAVVWWNDRALALRLAEQFERSPVGGLWEISAPFLRSFAAGEAWAEAPARFRVFAEMTPINSRNRCRLTEAAVDYFAMMGDHEHALEWLEQLESLSFVNVLWLDRCPCLDALRDSPRFARVRALVAARAEDLWR